VVEKRCLRWTCVRLKHIRARWLNSRPRLFVSPLLTSSFSSCFRLSRPSTTGINHPSQRLLPSGKAKEEYELSEISQFRATMNNDDVLAVLHHHWAVCNDYYPVERQRLQHALLILLCAGTSARTGTIIEGGGYYDKNDALKYKVAERVVLTVTRSLAMSFYVLYAWLPCRAPPYQECFRP